MSLEKIELPAFLLADIFQHHLVEVIEKDASVSIQKESVEVPLNIEKKATSPDKKWYLGNNEKKITIIVNDADAVYLKDEWLQFLSNILAACKLNLGDVAIINFAQSEIVFKDVQEKLEPLHLIVFDVALSTLQIPFTIPHYQLQSYSNCQFLTAPSLGEMLGQSEQVKVEKAKLWGSLKKMFNI
ncbi:MAG: hypothetical protein ACOVNY_02305 [Chitinophagaceae bacterium]